MALEFLLPHESVSNRHSRFGTPEFAHAWAILLASDSHALQPWGLAHINRRTGLLCFFNYSREDRLELLLRPPGCEHFRSARGGSGMFTRRSLETVPPLLRILCVALPHLLGGHAFGAVSVS